MHELSPNFRLCLHGHQLLQENLLRFRDSRKQELFDIAYPDKTCDDLLTVTSWNQICNAHLFFDSFTRCSAQPNFYNYKPTSGNALEWHVNFADTYVFYAYGSSLFAQDEMQVAEHPLLACVREYLVSRNLPATTRTNGMATPLLVRGVPRVLSIATNPDEAAGRPNGLYGNNFRASSMETIRLATSKLEPPTTSNIIAMVAPTGSGVYKGYEILNIFLTAYTAFNAAEAETKRSMGLGIDTVVHSGFWGCGAFGGNRTLMIALQIVAAAASGVHLVIHTGDEQGMQDFELGQKVANDFITNKIGCDERYSEAFSITSFLEHFERMEFRWGISDGN